MRDVRKTLARKNINILVSPCPFCGGEFVDHNIKSKGYVKEKGVVTGNLVETWCTCQTCGCTGRKVSTTVTYDHSKSYPESRNNEGLLAAVEAWNKRKVG